MNKEELNKVARQMVVKGKGILAADESTGTIEKRFNKINLPNVEENRQAYREMLLTAPGLGEHISGVIMYDETLRQSTLDGRTFVSILESVGVLPGIKVDMGAVAMEGSPEEKVTKGLEGLDKRLAEYHALGAKFAKWRAVITIGEGIPTETNLRQNAKDLAAYAKLCQEADIVPIVEPEVLMDGAHTLSRCEEVSEQILTFVFEELESAGVELGGMILKPNMVVPGKESGENITGDEVAEHTAALFKRVLPDKLAGIMFLSGGQSEVEATVNLNNINKKGPFPWPLTFSYGRALQDSALKTWAGKSENVAAAQEVFLKRARLNGQAAVGEYTGE